MKPIPLPLLLAAAMTHLVAAPSVEIDPDFAPEIDGTVHAIAPLPDGRIVVGGEFEEIGGITRPNLALLNAGGTPDPGFTGTVDGAVLAIASAPDGTAYVGGAFNLPARHIFRISAAGAMELLPPGSGTSGRIDCLAVEPGGVVAFGGPFRRINGAEANYAGRLMAGGALDTNFSCALQPGMALEAGVDAIALQADSKMLVAGNFSTSAGDARLVRLNADGSVDGSLSGDHGPMLYPKVVVALPGGRILVAGIRSSAGDGFVRRLSADGSVDVTFNPPALDGAVETVAVDEAGGMVVGGSFNGKLMRLRADGSRDGAWAISADGTVKALAIQGDGAVLVGGAFSQIGDLRRKGFARLNPRPSEPHAFATNANGRFLARLQGEEGALYVIESSVDLHNWSHLGNFVAGADGISVSDENLDAHAHRFFRARRVE